MTELVVRHIDFRFDDSIPFHWNPGNPYWGNLVNFITLMAPPFERYAIRATRAALPRIHDQAVKEDAELFCRQEAQHARHHRAHMTLLTRKHPGLEGVLNDINASFEAMYRRESLDYHLAYVATVELCFGPLASFVIENREALFIDADPHIAGFMLWHLVEELEHRNSAIDIYRDVVGSHAYRLKTLAKTGRQLNEVGRIAREGFNRHAPAGPGGVEAGDVRAPFSSIPRRRQLALLCRLAGTLLPFHRPDRLRQPPWVGQWCTDQAAGMDMTRYYPQGRSAL